MDSRGISKLLPIYSGSNINEMFMYTLCIVLHSFVQYNQVGLLQLRNDMPLNLLALHSFRGILSKTPCQERRALFTCFFKSQINANGELKIT